MPTSKTLLLSEPHHISEHADKMTSVGAIGVDTEFVRERTYFPRPGLLQFSDGDQAWLVDPVTLEGSPELENLVGAIMANAGASKILHSTGEDLEVIDMVGHAEPAPLFDTQRAAALVGWPLQIRYEILARDLLGVEFPGGLGRNDWRRRPLPEAWIEYAANDVIALPRMREVLSEKLEQAGRMEWLIEDCRRILQRQHLESDPVVRIKGAAGLSNEELERLARLARWREEQARSRDIPRGFVVADPVLLELARQTGMREQDFDRFAGGRQRVGKRDRAKIMELIDAAPQPYVRPPELGILTNEQRARIKEMQGHVKQIADELQVEPAVIASKRDLTRKVQGIECDWLDGWRGELLRDL